MSEQIERFKSDEEMTPGDWIKFRETSERPESDAYRQARRKALEGAGLEHDDPADKSLEEMTAADHAQRKYGGGKAA